MELLAEKLDYIKTKSFSKIVIDYVENVEQLKPFYNNTPTKENILLQIQQKSLAKINRQTLTATLNNSYKTLTNTNQVQQNIDLLKLNNTFTICTAHQPNIFTGHLYFVYKILHTVKLAQELKKDFATYNFVPIFYMGSEDADLEELGHINIDNEKWDWNTNQKGAVGRMVIDEKFLKLTQKIKNRFGNEPFGDVIVNAIAQCYTINKTIQQATLEFIHFLFGQYGVLVLIADDIMLKSEMVNIFKNEIENQSSHKAAVQATNKLQQLYKGQAYSRPINLFYLINNNRERIELNSNGIYEVLNTSYTFTKETLINEIETNPHHFSPNVILRGLYQETILPNIAFIGGGGEIAYWLQLKEVFHSYNTLFPILIVRNSFLLASNKQMQQWQQLGFSTQQLFDNTIELETLYTNNNTSHNLSTANFQNEVNEIYNKLQVTALGIDPTLVKHIAALQTKTKNKLVQVEKKFLKAEKRKFVEKIFLLQKIKASLFPNNNLQERNDNIIPYFSKYGFALLDSILENSLTTEQQFTILTIKT